MTRKRSNDRLLGMQCPISRRDFVNGVLAGSGAALLSSRAPAAAKTQDAAMFSPSGSAWTGYGGVGDYRWSNGNTEAVREAAHGIRDHRYPHVSALPAAETYDVVIVGGGFSGMSAAYEFSRRKTADQSCLLLENHPVIGGEAKQNEFEVDGKRLVAPQGSNAGLVIQGPPGPLAYGDGRYQAYADVWHELDLPDHFELEPLAGGAEKYNLPSNHYNPMELETRYAAGYYFKGTGWAENPIANQFKNTPWPAETQRALDDFVNNRRDVVSGVADADRWLDSISYQDLLTKLGYGSEVSRYIDPFVGVGNFGVCSNAVSGYAAKRLTLPGTIPSVAKSRFSDIHEVSFPGGNAVILRAMLKRMLPDTIGGDASVTAIAKGALNTPAFDRPGNAIRIRLGSTAVQVQHDGSPDGAATVSVTYAKDGKLHKVRARAVIMSSGGWVNRNIVGDLPEEYIQAYSQFRYGPILTANVAVRHWRFFDKLGFAVARWFTGFGWHVCVRRNLALGKDASPLTPDSPIVLTFYVPFLNRDIDPAAQGTVGRLQLLNTSYAEFERQIREQMSEMFGPSGFEARRDIAGIVLNRWGHSFFAPPLGFFFGSAGRPAPHEVLHRPHGRVIFAHSELQGNMNMAHAMLEGQRGASHAMQML